MKKIFATALGIIASLTFALPAYAQVNVNPCGTTSTGGFVAPLCKFSAADIGRIIGVIVTTLLILAAIIALLFLIWGGIRWITSGGDKAKVESARNTIISAIIGLVIAFLAFFILTLILNFFGVTLDKLVLPKFTQ